VPRGLARCASLLRAHCASIEGGGSGLHRAAARFSVHLYSGRKRRLSCSIGTAHSLAAGRGLLKSEKINFYVDLRVLLRLLRLELLLNRLMVLLIDLAWFDQVE
jgi:hypothetical protein